MQMQLWSFSEAIPHNFFFGGGGGGRYLQETGHDKIAAGFQRNPPRTIRFRKFGIGSVQRGSE